MRAGLLTMTGAASGPNARTLGLVRTAAQHLVDRLVAAGTSHVFFVPGESYPAVLDALLEATSVRSVVCRHEAAAANMADAYGKLTGRPGVCFVSRGPGATHASIAVHTAYQDCSPMVLVIGDVALGERNREAFQEIDFQGMFAPLAKQVIRVDAPGRVAESIDTALWTATAGRPGPVVVAVPEDVLAAPVIGKPRTAPAREVSHAVDHAALKAVARALAGASRPLVIAGGGGWTQDSSDGLAAFATTHAVPVATAFRCQDVIDNDSPCFIGHLGIGASPALWDYARRADLIVNIGARFDAPSTKNFTLFDPGVESRTIVHFHPDAEQFARWPEPQIGVVCQVHDAVGALTSLNVAVPAGRKEFVAAQRAALAQWRRPPPTRSPVDLGAIVSSLSVSLRGECVITNGAGNYTGWLHRHFSFRRVGSYVGPRNGAMGYGLPAAIVAKLLRPDVPVVAFAGDGCFQMASQELATIRHYELPIVLVVVNNNMYGTIRMHQERAFPGRQSGTAISNPDFVQLARSYGFGAHVVETTEQFSPAIADALASDRATLIEIRTPEHPISAMET